MVEVFEKAKGRDWRVSDFDFDLPKDLIAQRPQPQRSASRLLQLDPKSQSITEHDFPEFENFLSPGDVLVLNDTKVVPAAPVCTEANWWSR